MRALDRSAERLRVARRKLVAAQDLERERLERNLHDGAQQYLVAAIISLRAAGDVDRAADILTAARSDLVALAGGAAPPALSGGIAAALERSAELARRSGARVTVTVDDDRHRDDQAWVVRSPASRGGGVLLLCGGRAERDETCCGADDHHSCEARGR